MTNAVQYLILAYVQDHGPATRAALWDAFETRLNPNLTYRVPQSAVVEETNILLMRGRLARSGSKKLVIHLTESGRAALRDHIQQKGQQA